MNESQKNKAIVAEIKAKALQDSEFKAKLLADPSMVLRMAGAEFDDGVTVKVVENTADTRYIVLPNIENVKLSDEELDAVAGGGATIATVAAYTVQTTSTQVGGEVEAVVGGAVTVVAT